MSTIKSKSSLVALIPKVVAGLRSHFAGQTLTFNGKPVTVEEVCAELQAWAASVAADVAAKGVWSDAVAAERVLAPSAQGRLNSVRELVRMTFGSTSVALTDFGMTPRKLPQKRTAAIQTAANEKAAATRIARHTMSTKQKAQIHGVVPTTAPLPATATEPAATAPAPLPSTPAAVKSG
jgi:hypothetical protein